MKKNFWCVLLVTGAEGDSHYNDSHHKTSPNGNIEGHKISPGYMEKSKWAGSCMGIKFSDRTNILYGHGHPTSIPTIPSALRLNVLPHEDSMKYSHRESPNDLGYDRGQPHKLQNHHGTMSYHNMFTPSQEPGTLWRCRSCGKEVTNRWHHFHSHTAQRSMCPYCPATYSRIDTLRSHLKQKHKNEHAHKNY